MSTDLFTSAEMQEIGSYYGPGWREVHAAWWTVLALTNLRQLLHSAEVAERSPYPEFWREQALWEMGQAEDAMNRAERHLRITSIRRVVRAGGGYHPYAKAA